MLKHEYVRLREQLGDFNRLKAYATYQELLFVHKGLRIKLTSAFDNMSQTLLRTHLYEIMPDTPLQRRLLPKLEICIDAEKTVPLQMRVRNKKRPRRVVQSNRLDLRQIGTQINVFRALVSISPKKGERPNAQVFEALIRVFNQGLRHNGGDIQSQLWLLENITKMHSNLDLGTLKRSEVAWEMLEVARRSRMGYQLLGREATGRLER